MKVIVTPGKVEGTIIANPSKSATQRAIAAALLAKGESIIFSPGKSDDCIAAINVAKKLGAEITTYSDKIEITSNGIHPTTNQLNCGESGLGIRLFTPIAALSEKNLTVLGEGSLKTRPMVFFEEILPQLGVTCVTNNGVVPLQIKGPLQAKDIAIDGSISSQFLTGLLMSYGAVAHQHTITVHHLTSRPYIELTLDIMGHFGVTVEHENLAQFHFDKKQSYQPSEYTVEGDWSGAAFLLVAGAIAGKITLHNLDLHSAQSDKAILDAIAKAGGKVTIKKDGITVEEKTLTAIKFDATNCPDLFPPLVALAANCKGKSVIKGVHRLKHKESDRGIALQEEFGKLGIQIELIKDEMIIYGGGKIQSATVHSHFDHRIAMACGIAALKATGTVTILNAEAINKSYPNFWNELGKLTEIDT